MGTASRDNAIVPLASRLSLHGHPLDINLWHLVCTSALVSDNDARLLALKMVVCSLSLLERNRIERILPSLRSVPIVNNRTDSVLTERTLTENGRAIRIS